MIDFSIASCFLRFKTQCIELLFGRSLKTEIVTSLFEAPYEPKRRISDVYFRSAKSSSPFLGEIYWPTATNARAYSIRGANYPTAMKLMRATT